MHQHRRRSCRRVKGNGGRSPEHRPPSRPFPAYAVRASAGVSRTGNVAVPQVKLDAV